MIVIAYHFVKESGYFGEGGRSAHVIRIATPWVRRSSVGR
jgi:hypothetical protein